MINKFCQCSSKLLWFWFQLALCLHLFFITLWEKGVFYNQYCTLATRYIYVAIHCNPIAILSKQLIFNYYVIPLELPLWCHTNIINCHPFLKIEHVTLWRFFGIKIKFFSKYWYSLSIMIINDGSKLWHVA
jgi:hypothetical protein